MQIAWNELWDHHGEQLEDNDADDELRVKLTGRSFTVSGSRRVNKWWNDEERSATSLLFFVSLA